MKVFIISLPDSRQRRLSAIANIRRSGLPFEIVDGVEARRMRPDALPVREGKWGQSLRPEEVGCYYAHLRALQRIVDYDLPWGCVLEDDFCYEEDPDVGLAEIANVLPGEFDYIGIFRTLGINPKHERLASKGPYWRVCEPELLATGYLAHRRFAEHILKHHPVCEMPIDHLYAQLSHDGVFYELKRPIVAIAPNLGSDIHDAEE
ncbi:MAG: glycosyltransferase family 25 protein [Planctomycetaceae bacterium]